MSFRAKIFFAVVLTGLALVPSISYFSVDTVKTQANATAEVSIERAVNNVNGQLGTLRGNLREKFVGIANPRFYAALEELVTNEDIEGFMETIDLQFQVLFGGNLDLYPISLWVGPDGKTLLRQVPGVTDHICDGTCTHPEAALLKRENEEAFGVFWTPEGLIASFLFPMVAGEEFYGVAILSRRIEGLLVDVAEASGVQIVVRHDGNVVYTTLRGAESVDFASQDGEVRVGEESYRYRRLEELDLLVPMVSLAVRDRTIRDIKLVALFSVVGAVIVASGVATWVAGTMSKPVLALDVAARRIGAGELDVKVDIRSKDELGRLGATFNEMVVGLQERARRAEIMTKTLSKEVSDKMMTDEVKLGGEKKMATIMFLDVRGFTSLTEGMDPATAVGLVNEIMTRVEGCIQKHHGVVNKYLGDGAMALFGVPDSTGNDALNAIEAARDIQREMKTWNDARVARGEGRVHVGVGINTDVVLAGYVGSERRLEFTVIGEGANLSSRLCGKAEKDQNVASYVTVRDAGIEARELEPVHVKGFSMPIRVYEV